MYCIENIEQTKYCESYKEKYMSDKNYPPQIALPVEYCINSKIVQCSNYWLIQRHSSVVVKFYCKLSVRTPIFKKSLVGWIINYLTIKSKSHVTLDCIALWSLVKFVFKTNDQQQKSNPSSPTVPLILSSNDSCFLVAKQSSCLTLWFSESHKLEYIHSTKITLL